MIVDLRPFSRLRRSPIKDRLLSGSGRNATPRTTRRLPQRKLRDGIAARVSYILWLLNKMRGRNRGANGVRIRLPFSSVNRD